jgi:hypothetical protein
MRRPEWRERDMLWLLLLLLLWWLHEGREDVLPLVSLLEPLLLLLLLLLLLRIAIPVATAVPPVRVVAIPERIADVAIVERCRIHAALSIV